MIHYVNNIAGVDPSRLIDNYFITRTMSNPALRATANTTWRTLETFSEADIKNAVMVYGDVQGTGGQLELMFGGDGGATVLVSLRRTAVNIVTVSVAAHSSDEAHAIISDWRKKFPKAPETESDFINVQFWFMSEDGPQSRMRRLVAPTWDEIKGNYTAAHGVQSAIAQLMHFKPSSSGQLLLWHGVPGTGKTYALRALARAWRKWCSFSYVTDPEKLFGSRADYLMATLLQNDDDPDDDDDRIDGGRWRLLILEDAGEMLVPDARQQVGQGLSRLLNLVDGLLGQGLRVLVLVTTNEPVGKLHPAISRAGRCASNVEFLPLTFDEGRRWLLDHGMPMEQMVGVKTLNTTLASLYEKLKVGAVAEAESVVGFRGCKK